jgi:HK97 family phage major capsid protein
MGAEHGRASMEYRTAFRDWVQTGKLNKDVLEFDKRADATGTASDLGVLLPETVMQEIIKGVGEVHGQLYNRVRKTNLKGGVKYPIGSFSATFNRITETTKSFRQDAGGITGYVAFGYKIGEIRLARTLLQTVLSVPVFEQEFAKVVAEAYVKAMDIEIMSGTEANNQCVGILTEAAAQSSRIPAANIIEFTAAEAADWTEWQKKLFAKIPLGMRAERPEFAMTAATYESVIKTLADDQNHPVYAEPFNPVDGTEKATFKGKEVIFVENDSLKDFDSATNGQFFAMYWVPQKAYAINSNMEFTVVDYFDHETNQYVKKALVINDGKVLDGEYIYLLKKKITG